MKNFDPDIHHRRSIRLRDYEYAANGAYGVTICVQGRECLFGKITEGEVDLSESGGMIKAWWRKIPEKFGNARLDEYVIMPDHFHGIIHLVGADPCVRPGFSDPCVRPGFDLGVDNQGAHTGAPLHTIVQWFKTMTTNAYIRGVEHTNWPPFHGRLWQRNYYERIIRDEAELRQMRDYVAGNPGRWAQDDSDDVDVGALLAAPGAERAT